MALGGYPPELHFLADLGIELDAGHHPHTVARLPVTPHLLGLDGGVHAGVLATLVDIVGGSIAMRAVHPDWMVTADMSLQVVRPAVGPVVEARGSILRQGRTTLVVEVEVFDGGADDRPVAWSVLSFAVLPLANGDRAAVDLQSLPSSTVFGIPGLDQHLLDVLSIASGDQPDTLAMPIDQYVRNSIGAVQGGVVALLAEVAAARAVAASLQTAAPVVSTDLQITYLATGRIGPLVARVRSVTADPASGSGRGIVDLVDTGADDRLAAVVAVGAMAW